MFKEEYEFAEGVAPFNENGKWGYIDIFGKAVIEPKYDYADTFTDGYACIKIGDENDDDAVFGFIDKEGVISEQKRYDFIGDFENGIARARKHGRWGYVNKSGELINDIMFDHISTFKNGFARVKINNKWGYIDETGKLVIQAKYDKVFNFSADGIAEVVNADRWKKINTRGEELS